MSLQDLVKVNTHYTRSVNLERDSNSIDVVKAYIPTSRALRTFDRIAEAFGAETIPRAWSLIGPYGSGKSSFAVFLSKLLSDPSTAESQAARQVLENADKELSNKFVKETRNSGGHLEVLITGAPESLSKRLAKGFAEAAGNYWKNIQGRNPKVIRQLQEAAESEISTSEIIHLIVELQQRLEKASGKGILLIIDELGKFLEYEARHYGANDIYLLQSLAEHACKGGNANLYLFVLLHQSFEQYAKGLGENLKNEWSKVQGRFEEVPFLESAEQVLRVVSAAFKYKFNEKQCNAIKKQTLSAINVLTNLEAIPTALKHREALKLYANCYPLHPVSAVILPLLCQKVAQNERTLFSYLGSHEEFGLQYMLREMKNTGDYVYPHHIYDYFISNQPAVLGDYLTNRRWVEVVTAVERLGDAPEYEINLLKTIGILNIIGSKAGLKASSSILGISVAGKAITKKVISSLEKKSIINYRRFNSEYRVWQGSDFDLEEAIQVELNNVGEFSLAAEINAAQNMLPIVARKYTIQTGTLRYFSPTFVDAKSYKSTQIQSNEPRIIFYLALDQADEKIYYDEVIKYFSKLDIIALSLNGAQLREAVAESLALKRVGTVRQELNSDPVAKREYEDRLTAAEQSESRLLRSLLDFPSESIWYHNASRKIVPNKRAMQEMLSSVLNQVYTKTPKIFNELVNRDKPSSQANAARNKLLCAMQNDVTKVDLGIEKFPPEKAIYRAVFRETGLHQQKHKNGAWHLVDPLTAGFKDKANIRHVWKRIDRFLDSTESQSKSFVELSAELIAPPYGVKAGLLPFLYIAAYLVYQHEVALYENRRYRPKFTEEMLERFVKRPDEFEFQRFKISGLRASIFEQYSKVIHGDTKIRTILELVKPLASFMGNLPEYTQKTRRGLSERAIKVRSAFNLAKSPERLLFEELPEALGFEDISEKIDSLHMEEFSQLLTESLRELRDAYKLLLERQKELLAQSFNMDPNLSIENLRKVVSGNCHGLENYTVDTKGLRGFIIRLTNPNGEAEEWLENTLIFLGNKPTNKWQDSDQDTAEYRLTDLSRRIIDLEKLRLHDKDVRSKIDGDFDVFLLRSIKKGGDIQDEVVVIDEGSAKRISTVKHDMMNSLNKLADKELKLGALAEIVDEFLRDYKDQQKTRNVGTQIEFLKEAKR